MKKNKMNGRIVDGEWTTDPNKIKEEVWQYFSSKFSESITFRPKFVNSFKKLTMEDRNILDGSISLLEIKKVVLSCGDDKASQLDGFTFKFIKEFWDNLKFDIISFVKNFESAGKISRDVTLLSSRLFQNLMIHYS